MTAHPYDHDLAAEVIRFGVFAADMEVLGKPAPVSSIRNPDGSLQPETRSEQTRRIVGAAIMHLLEAGLLVIPDNATALIEAGIPLEFGIGTGREPEDDDG